VVRETQEIRVRAAPQETPETPEILVILDWGLVVGQAEVTFISVTTIALQIVVKFVLFHNNQRRE
jgi:hypothetical protein